MDVLVVYTLRDSTDVHPPDQAGLFVNIQARGNDTGVDRQVLSSLDGPFFVQEGLVHGHTVGMLVDGHVVVERSTGRCGRVVAVALKG